MRSLCLAEGRGASGRDRNLLRRCVGPLVATHFNRRALPALQRLVRCRQGMRGRRFAHVWDPAVVVGDFNAELREQPLEACWVMSQPPRRLPFRGASAGF